LGKGILMELRDHTIFILGAAKFDSAIESTSFTIAKHLARHNKVYYLDYPFTWKDCLKLRNTEQFRLRKPYFKSAGSGIFTSATRNLKIVILPPLASINFLPEGKFYRFLLKLIEGRIRKRLKKIIAAEGLKNIIYINSYNFHYPGVADGLSPVLTVYQCVDPLVIPYDRKHGLISEALLVKKSDLVICTSKQLCEEKKLLNKNTHFIPNAADITHSQKALDPDLPVHPKLKNIGTPVIGYFGNIERRMDFSLLQDVIVSNQDKCFVFAGPYSKDDVPEWFFTTPNVHFTGRLPYDEMPAVVKGFNVALIPFKKDQYSRTIFPLKLFEYLGAGKPVVATDFNPDLQDFTGGTVYFADHASAFSDAINKAIHDDPIKELERIAVAHENTWEKRMNQLDSLLLDELKKSYNH